MLDSKVIVDSEESDITDEEVPTFALAAKIWWSWTWRRVGYALVVNVVLWFVLVLGITQTGWILPGRPVWWIFGTGLALHFHASIQVLKFFMTKGFGSYRLAVVKR